MSRETARFFDSYASDFEAIYGNRNTPLNRLVNGLFRKSMRLRYEHTMTGCTPLPGSSVLDIGCGPGHYSVDLARRGAARVLGIDFAPGMLELASRRAAEAGVAERCTFRQADFLTDEFEVHDFVIAMGFMDYMADARAVVDKVLRLARRRALLSFPADGGFLAWQRKVRYRWRCPLYLYREAEVRALFDGRSGVRAEIAKLGRDYFVTATRS